MLRLFMPPCCHITILIALLCQLRMHCGTTNYCVLFSVRSPSSLLHLLTFQRCHMGTAFVPFHTRCRLRMRVDLSALTIESKPCNCIFYLRPSSRETQLKGHYHGWALG